MKKKLDSRGYEKITWKDLYYELKEKRRSWIIREAMIPIAVIMVIIFVVLLLIDFVK